MVYLGGMDPTTSAIGSLMIWTWAVTFLFPIAIFIGAIGGAASANPTVNVVVHGASMLA